MDSFQSAAAGNADAQEAMARTLIQAWPDLNDADDVVLSIAYLWSNMALTNGNLTIRPLRVSLLIILARRALSKAPERARAYVVDALAQAYELAAEGDAGATAFLPCLLDAVTKDFGRMGRMQIIGAAGDLATARAKSLPCVGLLSAPTTGSTAH